LSAAGRLLLDPESRGGADLRAVVRLRFGAGGADRAVDLLLSDRGQYRDGPRNHRTRTRGRAEGARRQQARHSLERRAAADHAVLLCVAEGRGLLRLCRRRAVGNRGLEPRHRQRHDDRILQFQRAAGVRRPVRARRPRCRALRHLLGDRGTRHRLGHPQERPARDMKHVSANRHPTLIEETKMLARVSAALLGVALFAGTACAQETTIKFTLGWKTQGSDAAFFYAKDNGYFKEEGLNVVIDQGEGSGATVTRIMSGAYDAGFGDVNAIIQNASTKPQDAPVMVYMIWNQPPFAIVAKKTSGINTIKDFEGHTLGGAQGTPTTRLLPVFVQKNKLEGEKIKISN